MGRAAALAEDGFAQIAESGGDGFELLVREHRDSRMCTHLVVDHRAAVHVPVLIYRLRPLEARTTANWGCCWVRRRRPAGAGLADHRHGLEVEVAKLFPGGSRKLRRDGVRGDGSGSYSTTRPGWVPLGPPIKILCRGARQCASTNRSTNKASIACVFEGRARTAYNACRKTTSTRPRCGMNGEGNRHGHSDQAFAAA